MMDKPVNWGILGAANFALNHMGPAIQLADNARLYALATSSPAKADGFRAFCPDLKVHLSYDDLLTDDQVEAVYIPLPNHLHVDWAKKALRAGKHVLCEKPIALRSDEIDALIDLRDQTGLMIAEAYMIVHHPQWQRARTLVQDGAIGKLVHVDGVFSYFNDDMGNYRNHAEFGGGGIRDIGVYTYGSARFVTGQEPDRITHTNIRWENGVDTYAHVLAEFPGFSYSAVVSMRMAARQQMVFHGEAGILRLNAPFNAEQVGEPTLLLNRSGQPDVIERFPRERHYKNQVENFGRTLRGGADYPWDLENARGTQAMIDRVFDADRSKNI